MEIVAVIIIALVAYLLGSIPTGYLAGRARGIDIRSMGSGNIGATNAFRILGRTAGTIVLVTDCFKGWASVAVVPWLIWKMFSLPHDSAGHVPEYVRIIAGVVAILGHNYTCWLKFKGGKGVATTGGVLLALVPWSFVICLGIWTFVCVMTRYVSLASIVAAISLPVVTMSIYPSRPKLVVTLLMGALAIFKHQANIKRLMNGTENKVGRKPVPPATGAPL